MHSRTNPLRFTKAIYYASHPWILDPTDMAIANHFVPINIEVTIVPAGSHKTMLRIEFVNLTGAHLPKARPRATEQIEPLLDTIYKLIIESIDCDCCLGKELKPITMHNVCWNDE